MRRVLTRRAAGISAAAFAGTALFPRGARAAQFEYKLGNSLPIDHPMSYRAVEMAANVKRETAGRMVIQCFPNGVLGSDAAMIEQARVGALQFSVQSGNLFTGLVPTAAIQSIPYAFPSVERGMAAMNGELGAAVRREITAKTNFYIFPTFLDSGFRQVTSSTHPIRVADDFNGFKILGKGQFYVDVYKALGAQVAVLGNNEVYTALQTHVVDGQDASYAVIETQRLFEVQKYLSAMDCMWGGAFVYCNGDAWKALPADIQRIVEKNMIQYGVRATRDDITLNQSLADKLSRQGLALNRADRATFKARLSPWYAKAKTFYGPALWGLLEKYGGTLG